MSTFSGQLQYSGKLVGDNVVYTDKAAALLKKESEDEKAGSYARSEEAPEISFEVVDYEQIGPGRCSVGRVLHDLRTSTREELIRTNALLKLNNEERRALGLH